MSENALIPGLRKWTIMVFLAGDNNLETYGIKDIGEMSSVGSSDEVSIVAQFDRMSDQVTRRYFITANQNLEDNCVAELDEVNTGDPQALLDFITWAYQRYPAERYGLVLWNHGSGWKDDDIYRTAEQRYVMDHITRGQVRGFASGKSSRALFSTTLERLIDDAVETERAILFDDSSADFLDNIELRTVLQNVVQHIGQPLDLLGFDACLMNMLEVHYQIRDLCHVIVGSQENEPGDGWPYDAILSRLVDIPAMTPQDLGKTIVDAYVGFYRTHHPGLSVTQSAILLANLEAVAERLDKLAKALKNTLTDRGTLGLLFSVLRAAQSFSDRDYVDLIHFCQLLAKNDVNGDIGKAAQKVVNELLGEASAVVAEGHHGSNVANAHGLSIYLPVRILSPLYSQLEFAQQNSWIEFLESFINPTLAIEV
jgi:hypothetical protein